MFMLVVLLMAILVDDFHGLLGVDGIRHCLSAFTAIVLTGKEPEFMGMLEMQPARPSRRWMVMY